VAVGRLAALAAARFPDTRFPANSPGECLDVLSHLLTSLKIEPSVAPLRARDASGASAEGASNEGGGQEGEADDAPGAESARGGGGFKSQAAGATKGGGDSDEEEEESILTVLRDLKRREGAPLPRFLEKGGGVVSREQRKKASVEMAQARLKCGGGGGVREVAKGADPVGGGGGEEEASDGASEDEGGGGGESLQAAPQQPLPRPALKAVESVSLTKSFVRSEK
jgi:hypothetical protein